MNKYNLAKEKALHFLNYKMRTEQEIYYRLKKDNFDDDIIYNVIDFLKEYNFLNDDYYVEMYIREKSNLNPIGKNKILYELKKKGIDSNIVNNVLEQIEFNEDTLIDKILEKKFDINENISYKEKNKIYNYLMRRGFNSSKILSRISRKNC